MRKNYKIKITKQNSKHVTTTLLIDEFDVENVIKLFENMGKLGMIPNDVEVEIMGADECGEYEEYGEDFIHHGALWFK